MTDWSRASLSETVQAIASGMTTSRAVVEACLDRIHRLDKTLSCFIEIDAAGARAAADRADARQRAGHPLGPLHGVPLAHKDMYYRAGRMSACGSKLRADWKAPYTATVLEKLDRAGAIEVGRLVMVEFAMGPHGYNQNYPLCRNPWSPDYIPCGSSSGSGVAVGGRMVHGSLGSDTGGSVRCPASVAGVVGLVPTYGRVSRRGAMPMSFSFDVVGPLARTARDCARLLGVIAGPDPADASSLDAPVADYEAELERETARPRIGIARGYFTAGLHPEVAHAIERAVDVFRRAGFVVEPVDDPSDLLHEVAELQPLIMKSEGAANHLAMLREHEADYTFEVGHRLHAGFFVPAASYIRALKQRGQHLRAFASAVFSKCDLLLTPVLSIPVPSIADTTGKKGKDYLDMVVALTRNTKVVNYFGLPAISVPCGFTANGLPAAFQLIARPLQESALLRAGHCYQLATEWHRQEPVLVSKLSGLTPGSAPAP
jgi:aspartyl-tRNA(Asn)/glutamyl-tRNA(Gln) amidotransferase subunit A